MAKEKVRKIKEVKKKIKKIGISEEAFEYIVDVLEERDGKIEVLQELVYFAYKESIPANERYFEESIVDNSSSKLTLNPRDGRVTLKLSIKSTENVRNELREFTRLIMMDETIDPTTIRGRFRFKDGKYLIDMQSNNKKYCKHYEMRSI